MVLQRIVPKFILFLVFLLVVSVATPGQPVLADNFGDYTYTNHGDGTVTITDYNGTATDVNIPGTLNGLTVIGIGMDAFRSNALTSVTIPDGVRTIGAQAFLYNNLTSVTIPGSVTSIGDHAFRQSGLRSVTLSDGVTTIGAAAFSENDLSSVTIPGSVTTIGDQAFRDNSLTSVTILNGVQTIGNYAFILNSVSSVTIPGSVTSIGEHAFRDNSLTSVTIPDGVTTIGVSAFYNNSLTSVTLPDSLTSIGNSAFMNNSLTSVTIPDSSMTIGNGAFQANALRSIAIPDSIPEIGEYAFSYNQLSSVRINGSDTIIGAHAFEGNQPSSADLTLISFDPSTAKDYAADYGHTFNAFADLTSLTLSAGSLDPAFASDTEEYTASVANSVNTIEVTPTTAVGTSTVTVNGDTVTSGNASDPIALNVGANTITLVVTPQNGSTKTYTVEVTRAASSNANLSDLTLSAGSLDPVFASGTEEYTASVANSVNEIEVTPTVDAGTSTVTVNGGTVTTGSASDPIALNVGANTITVEVTAQDNSTKTYTIEVTRAASSNANLSDLTLSAGSLDPAFASGTEAYTASVANSVNEIEVTPTTAVGTSTVAVNGATVTSGSASDPIALIVGANTITVEVTAQDNSTKTYTIEVTRAASSNANLSGLTLSAGSLDPAFASGTEDYTASVANSVNNIEVTPTTAVGTSTVTVNGGTVTSGSASDPIALNVGVNTITVEVTAQDNSTKTYTVEVTRAASSNANLSGLTLSAGSLDPAFASGTEEYTASVANSVNTIEVTPTTAVGTSTVTVNGGTVTSGSASDPIALNVGVNTITVEVTAQDNSTKTYTVEVTRAASSNANLSGLMLSEGSLDPVFASGTEAYSVSVANSVNTIEVTPTVVASTSTVTVNGETVTSGSASDPIALNVGANTITMVVTAQNGSTKTYTVEVTRAASSNANLSGLTLSAGSLDPVFASGTEEYSVAVANSVNTIEVTPTTAVGTSTVTVNGETVTSGSASGQIALNVGENTINVVVTAQDNSTRAYTVTVTRAASSNANLSGLTLSAGSLDPAFASGTEEYTASVANSVNTIEVTPTTAVGTSTVTVNGGTVTSGSASDPIALNVGVNTITVEVTAQDNSTKTYTVEVTRAASSNANLSGLTLSAGSLDPVFASGTEEYSVAVVNSVNTIEVTPTTAVGTSTVTVNGETVTSGSVSDPIALNVGENTITVEVTAQDSSTKTYTVEVTRAASSNANLSGLMLSEGSLDPAFASGTEAYSVAVANSVNTIEVTPITAVGTSTVTVNGNAVTSGSASDPIALNVGANTITVEVTAQDNSTKTYTIEVTRAASSNTNLSGLMLSEGSLDPAFASGTEDYTATVANSVDTIEVTPTVDDGPSTVTVNGDTVISGSASDPIALNVGTNLITVVVTAQNGSTKTYTVEVTRAASSNANLSGLTLSEGSLDPAFASGTEDYTAVVANNVNTIEVTPTTAVGTSTVTVNGETVTSGSASDPVALNVGANMITVEVTAQNGSTKTYTIEVTRAASSNGNLSNLTLSEGSLNPAFASGTEDYTASVANSVNTIKVTPTVDVGTSTVTVNGDTVTSGSASDPIALNVGTNTITVEVTAQDSSTKTYTITVTRAAYYSSDNDYDYDNDYDNDEDNTPPKPVDTTYVMRLTNEGSASHTHTFTFEQGELLREVIQLDSGSLNEGKPLDAWVLTIPAQTMRALVASNLEGTVRVLTDVSAYDLPVSVLSGIDATGVTEVTLRIGRVDSTIMHEMEQAAAAIGARLAAVPVETELAVITADGKRVVQRYAQYVSQTLALKEAGDSDQQTGVRYHLSERTFQFVPSRIDGAEATLQSRSGGIETVLVQSKTFVDVDGIWSEEVIKRLASKLIVYGKDEGRFDPDTPVTRAEMTAMLVRSLGLQVDQAERSHFNDVSPASWYSSVLAAAVREGLVQGDGTGKFRPEEHISREETVVMIMSAMRYATIQSKPDIDVDLSFYQDSDLISSWAKNAMAEAVQTGLILGNEENQLMPNKNTSRAEAAAMIDRLLRTIGFID